MNSQDPSVQNNEKFLEDLSNGTETHKILCLSYAHMPIGPIFSLSLGWMPLNLLEKDHSVMHRKQYRGK